MTTFVVLFVAIAAALLAMIASAISVVAWRGTSKAAAKLRSMTSMQGELIEIRDYLVKVDAWLKRISQREVMRERREDARSNEAGRGKFSLPASGATLTKDELRRRAGIVAGRPAPHSEDI
jgi:hypothetical protein